MPTRTLRAVVLTANALAACWSVSVHAQYAGGAVQSTYVVDLGYFPDKLAASMAHGRAKAVGVNIIGSIFVTEEWRIRMFAGPYARRSEAESTLSKLRAAGFVASIVLADADSPAVLDAKRINSANAAEAAASAASAVPSATPLAPDNK